MLDSMGRAMMMPMRTGMFEFTPNDYNTTDSAYIDTLKMSDLNMEGPNKTISGGQYNNPLIKWGKTATLEMSNALGDKSIFKWFYGADIVANGSGNVTNIGIGSKFSGPFAIQGETFLINARTGEEITIYIFIPWFLPNSVFNITQEAEGDATVFDISGTVGLVKFNNRKFYYDISPAPYIN